MALKIEHIDVNEVRGTLDGALNFEVKQEADGIVARVQDWSLRFVDQSIKSVADMRSIAYVGLANYRTYQKNSKA
jgi:hypothetical protein